MNPLEAEIQEMREQILQIRRDLEQDRNEKMSSGFVEGDYPPGYFAGLSNMPSGLGKTITASLNDLAEKGLLKKESLNEWQRFVPNTYVYTETWPYGRSHVDDLVETMKEYNVTQPKTWLEQTKEVTEQQRQKKYGSPLINFLRIAIRWTMWVQGRKGVLIVFSPVDVAWMMLDLKISREIHSHQDDNGIDSMGYLACHDAMDRHMKRLGYSTGTEAFHEMTLADLVELMEDISMEPEE